METGKMIDFDHVLQCIDKLHAQYDMALATGRITGTLYEDQIYRLNAWRKTCKQKNGYEEWAKFMLQCNKEYRKYRV